MGCFNLKGFMSDITIGYGDEVVLFLALYKPRAEKFYVCDEAIPIALPIYGKYDEYGGLEDIVYDDNVKWLEKNVGKIEDIISAIEETQAEYHSTIGDCETSDNEYHPETKVRYVYGNLKKLSPFIDNNSKLCLLFEHKALYEKWRVAEKELHNQYSFENQIGKYNEEKEKLIQAYSKRTDISQLVIDSVIESKLQDFITDKAFFLFDMARYTLFTLYRFLRDGYKFLLDHSKEIIEFEHFYTYAESICKGFTVPMQYTQSYHYETQIEYHKDCIDFINEKKKKFDE